MRVSSVLVSSLFIVACVGETPAPTVGTLGGPCFSNQTCNTGLACVDSKCVASDAGVDAAPPSDASGDGAIDTQNDPNNCGALGHICPSGKCKVGDCVRRVFVTSGTTKGTFGGSSGADNLCNVSAQGVPSLNGTYYAWISTSSSNPKTHFTKGKAPYVLVDGTTVVANDFMALTGVSQATSLGHAIDMDETGKPQSNVNVWTGTHADGTEAGPPNCSDFSANPTDANATIGSSSMTNTTWTESTTLACTTFAHVYCVEQ